jgi:ADP-ribosylglycohydrolase
MKKLDLDNYLGCIVGGAIGDALGAPTEFMDLDYILDKYGKIGVNDYVEFDDGIGHITDDTQMLLFTAEGLLRSRHRATTSGIGGAYRQICFHSYIRWLKTQEDWYAGDVTSIADSEGWLLKQAFLYARRAPGNTCLTSLRSGIAGTIDEPINDSKGCGGIMRIAPVGLLFYSDPKKAFQIGSELAAMTHGHPSGYLSAGFLAALIACINNGNSLSDSIQLSLGILNEYKDCEETANAVESAIKLYEKKDPTYLNVETLGGGWVGEEALAISLYCALSYQNDFEKAINLSINHGGDTDSTGAITGNILGFMLGEKAIPQRWINNLSDFDVIKQIGIDLHTEVKGDAYNYDAEWGIKYPPY